MGLWFFQLTEKEYPLRNYRLHVWENERWRLFVGTMVGVDNPPTPGDMVAFFYAPTKADEFGFFGWAVVLQWIDDERADDRELCFRPVAPSDYLKMNPWNDENAIRIANEIRGGTKTKTLWPIHQEQARELRQGIRTWLGGQASPGLLTPLGSVEKTA